jgi:hypothetical protein
VGVSSAKVTYDDVASYVGLQPWNKLQDIETFPLHRSRIPTDVFKAIVTDLDVMLMQYGPLPEHETEEARSRFFSPVRVILFSYGIESSLDRQVFNHLVKQFTFQLRNNPESIIGGRIGTQGRIEYFKTFGAIAILFIKLKIGNDKERLKAIARVIAESDGTPHAFEDYTFWRWPLECTGCDFNNASHGFSLPIHCIFSDGLTFEFFTFERTPNPTFRRGCFAGDPKHLRRGLKVPDFSTMDTYLPFILQLRCVCETIFDVMLSAYIAGLKAYHNRSNDRGKQRPSFDAWDRALQSAELAQINFREAETQRKGDDIASADVTVNKALVALKTRYYFHSYAGLIYHSLLRFSTGAVSTIYTTDLIMNYWDDDEVGKAWSYAFFSFFTDELVG